VYSLGAILYECLTGRPPFRAATAYETIRQVIADDPVPPRRLNPGVPRDLETIALKCLHKDPARRYASPQKLAAALGRLRGAKPPGARRFAPVGRRPNLARGRPASPAPAPAVILISVAGLAGVLWQWDRERQAHRASRHAVYAAHVNLADQAWR